MSVTLCLSALALRQVVNGVGEEGATAAIGLVVRWLRDPSQRLGRALTRSNDRAWRVLEMALAGDSLWERCKGLLITAEDRAFRQQVQEFLAHNPLGGVPDQERVRVQCLQQLQAARKAGVLTRGRVDGQELAQRTGHFARYAASPQALLDAERQTLAAVAEGLHECYPLAAQVVTVQLATGQPLLVVAARYFFRREVETDDELSRGLTFSQLEDLGQAQRAHFDRLTSALEQHGSRLDELFTSMTGLLAETHQVVSQVHSDLQRQGELALDTHDTVKRLLAAVETQLSHASLTPVPGLPVAAAVPPPFPPPAPPPPPPMPAASVPGTARLSWYDGRRMRTLHLLPLAVVEAGRQTSKPLCLRVEPVSDPVNRDRSLQISSHHLTFRYLGDCVEVLDPGSANGTFAGNLRLAPGQGFRVQPGLILSVAQVLDLMFQPVTRPNAPPNSAAVCHSARMHGHDAAWLQEHLIGVDRPGMLSFLRIVRKNNQPEEEYVQLFHSGSIGSSPEALIQVPGIGDLAQLCTHAGQLWLTRTGAEAVTVAGHSLTPGQACPLRSPCDWTVGRIAFRLEI